LWKRFILFLERKRIKKNFKLILPPVFQQNQFEVLLLLFFQEKKRKKELYFPDFVIQYPQVSDCITRPAAPAWAKGA